MPRLNLHHILTLNVPHPEPSPHRSSPGRESREGHPLVPTLPLAKLAGTSTPPLLSARTSTSVQVNSGMRLQRAAASFVSGFGKGSGRHHPTRCMHWCSPPGPPASHTSALGAQELAHCKWTCGQGWCTHLPPPCSHAQGSGASTPLPLHPRPRMPNPPNPEHLPKARGDGPGGGTVGGAEVRSALEWAGDGDGRSSCVLRSPLWPST